MHTLGALGVVAAAARPDDTFTGTLLFAGLAFPCLAFAWDGLVRRQALFWPFPVGATLGGNAAHIKNAWAVVMGVVAALLGGFFLLAAWGFYLVALQRQCPGRASLACAGALATSAKWVGWAWFGMCALWFVIVWLRLGDPRKRVLITGVWYHQERAARYVNQRLRAQGMLPLPSARLYQMEKDLVRWLRWHGWLGSEAAGSGQSPVSPAPGAQDAPRVAAAAEVLAVLEHEEVYLAADETQREALKALIPYFLDLARHGERQSAVARWWARTGQLARLGIYGRRTL